MPERPSFLPMTSRTSERSESQEGDVIPSGGEKHSARNPACDMCREKKVKCSREKPRCQNCAGWNTACTFSEHKKRDNEATRNQQRFEEVNDRLDRIESMMQRIMKAIEADRKERRTSNSTSTTARHHAAPPAVRPDSPAREIEETDLPDRPTSAVSTTVAKQELIVEDQKGNTQYMGPSSLLTITSEAGKIFSERMRAGGLAPSADGGTGELETIGALNKLSLVSSNVGHRFPYYGHQDMRNGAENHGTMEVPSKEEAMLLVEEFFRVVHLWFPIFEPVKFKREVEEFYRDPEQGCKDRGWMGCFYNVMLFGLYNRLAIMPRANDEDRKARKQVGERVRTYYYNGWKAIDDIDVFLGPRLRNVQALLTGAVCAIEVSRPGLCWSLLSQAARSCQAMGLHRATKPSSRISIDELQERRFVFWHVYLLDKTLSLAFGRASSLPDFDCDVELPIDDGNNPLYQSFIAMVQLAKIQSNIYVKLYSASALRQTEREMAASIRDLDRALRDWWAEWEKDFDNEATRVSFEYVELKFSYYSNMTLVHRMARPGMPDYAWSDKECLENARGAISTVNEVVERNAALATSGMLLWLFQYYPFSSFFVLFSAIIRQPANPASTNTDLPLMKALVAYLTRVQARNKGAEKLLQIASAFTHVAATYLKNWRKQEKAKLGHRRNSSTADDLPPGKRRRASDTSVPQYAHAQAPILPPLRSPSGQHTSSHSRLPPGPLPRPHQSPPGGPGPLPIANDGPRLSSKPWPTHIPFAPDHTAYANYRDYHAPHLPPFSASSASTDTTLAASPPPARSTQSEMKTPQSIHSADDEMSPVAQAVDLQVASFLRWPGHAAANGVGMLESAVGGGGIPQIPPQGQRYSPANGTAIIGPGGAELPTSRQQQQQQQQLPPPPQQQQQQLQPYPQPPASASSSSSQAQQQHQGESAQPGEYDIDLEAIMTEPVGFQIRMEQAAMRGPLEFDWFSWDTQFTGMETGM
ncbi:hypothetical protein EX30DRAFT_66309 [Ascodesmis nigricans]|uniref:Zn(2)-C6 fungal-type domain-containing protein n=1 Tax=Ascodesmis nigricans TaxID=341454 RepID=A0A4S2MU01_9PEZI|nr:hypothetical protein EX30DRAFT_66309 [Ascodesmis nigricans]